MAIVRYIPRKRDIVDRRSEKGGYWEMTCESCGTTFYPTRQNAKFCCRACGLQNWRERRKERDAEVKKLYQKIVADRMENLEREKESRLATTKEKNREVITGANNVINFLRSKKRFASAIKGQIGDIRYNMKSQENRSILDFDKFEIEKLSDRRFVVIW
tara:strand:+ start:253 stop:729 length:477 start_codon:yes stop_codon:yes gene_type:complete